MEFSVTNGERRADLCDVPYLPDDPRCSSPRVRSHGESQLIMISREGRGWGRVRQIKPSDRKATCLLAEGKQITLTRLGAGGGGGGLKTRDGCQRNIRSIAVQRFEKSGAEMYLSKKTYLESVSVNMG